MSYDATSATYCKYSTDTYPCEKELFLMKSIIKTFFRPNAMNKVTEEMQLRFAQ